MPQPLQTVEDLGKLVKKKYPVYNQLSDVDLGRRVRAKYPAYNQFLNMPDTYFKNEAILRQREAKQPQDTGSVAGQLLEDVMAIPGSVVQAFKDPKGTAKALLGAQKQEYEKAREAYSQGGLGNYSEAFGHGLAAALPIVGPAAAQAGEEFGSGQTNKGIAHTIELLGPEATKAVPIRPLMKAQRVAPELERALTNTERAGVDLNLGQRLRNPRLESMARSLQRFPGSEEAATDFALTQQEQLAGRGRELAARASPVQATDIEAGRGLRTRLDQRISRLKTAARYYYGSVERDAEAAKKTIQTGTKTVPGANPLATNTPAGMAQTVPVHTVFEAPVDLAPMRKGLQPLYEDLKRSMPEARRQNSPAFRALEELVTGKDQYMNAMDFDRSLGAIKALARGGGDVVTPAQRTAMAVVGEGEKTLAATLKNISPTAQARLARARQLWRSYHETAEFLGDLGEEPATVYQGLTVGKNRVFDQLTQLKRIAPQEIRTIGRTYLEGLMKKATEEGGFKRAEGVLADWKGMGLDTKKLLFGDKLTEDLNDFFLAAKRLVPAEGSATAGRGFSALPLGYLGEFLTGLISGHGLGGAALAAGSYYMAEHVGPSLVAKMLFSPGGARLMTRALTLPAGPVLRQTLRALSARAMKLESEEEQGGGASATTGPQAMAPPKGWRPEWSQMMADVSGKIGVPLSLLQTVAEREGSGHFASPTTVRSRAGAIGLMQITPATGRAYGYSPKDLENPHKNIYAAARLLKDLKAKYGDRTDLILAAYNAGEGALQRAGYDISRLPFETQQYVRRGLAR